MDVPAAVNAPPGHGPRGHGHGGDLKHVQALGLAHVDAEGPGVDVDPVLPFLRPEGEHAERVGVHWIRKLDGARDVGVDRRQGVGVQREDPGRDAGGRARRWGTSTGPDTGQWPP